MKTKRLTVISSEQNKLDKNWTTVTKQGIAWGQVECHNGKQKSNNNNNHSPWEPSSILPELFMGPILQK